MLFASGVSSEAIAQATADFSSSISQGCAPQLVKFNDLSSPAPASWLWDFGNGATSTLQNPSTVYTQPGVYAVTLTVNGPGGSASVTRNAFITIFTSPSADFSVNLSSACELETFSFTNASTQGSGSIVSHFWDFGDGDSSNTQSPTHAYNVDGNKSVSLRIKDANGCESFIIKPNILFVEAKPDLSFAASKTNSCVVPFLTNFSNTSSGSPLSYAWDFGDGNSSNLQSPSNTYSSPGQYTVTLYGTNTSNGCKDTLVKSSYINVGNSNIDFTPSKSRACIDELVSFNITGTGTPQSVLWNFGDGNISNDPLGQNTYSTPGTYTVKLVVGLSGGCKDSIVKQVQVDNIPVPNYSLNPDKSCQVPFNVTFVNNTPGNSSFWEFGDGDTSSQRNTIHTYNSQGPFIVKFTSITPGGCALTQIDTIDYKPEIIVKPTPRQVCGNSANVNFTHTSNPTGAIAYSWDFDDGSSSNLMSPSHFFANQGQYIVKLTLTYPGGCTSTGQDTVSIFSKPIPDFEADKRDTCVKITINFTNLSSNYTAFEWDFGDGGIDSINVDPTHKYKSWPKILELPDSFNVKLTLWNGTCQADTTITNYINIDPPLAWIETDNPEGLYCDTPAVVSFKDVSRYVNPRDTVLRVWYFNDPYAHKINFQQCTTDTKNNQNVGLNCNYSLDSLPTHTYSKFGNYNSQLWLFSHRTRCLDSISYLIRVRPKFNANFIASPLSGCAPLTVDMEDTTSRSVEWFWDFGDPRIDSDTDIVRLTQFEYVLPGKYYPRLFATDADGCIAVVDREIDVRGPIAGFKTEGKLCPPDTVSFYDISQKTDSLVSWHWDFGDPANSTSDTSNLRHPKFSFSGPGSYLVTLTAMDNRGCSNSLSRIIEYGPPIPDFTVVPPVVCVGDQVSFRNFTKGGFTNKYHWRFDNLDTSNLLNPAYIFPDTGWYGVFLKVTRPDQCSDSVYVDSMVRIVDPQVDFSANKTTGLCPPFTVVFASQTSDDVNEYYWDFGDSSYSTQANPIHTYDRSGLYTVSLRVKSIGGCYDSLIKLDYIEVGGPSGTFSFTPDQGCQPLTVKFNSTTKNTLVYTWDLGDGNILYTNEDSLEHTYNSKGVYKPILILTDSNNCSFTILPTDSLISENLAQADISLSSNLVCVGSNVMFNDLSTPGGAISSRNWVLDSVSVGNGLTFQSQFQDTGNHYMRLEITDTLGCIDDTTVLVEVIDVPDVEISNDTSICFGNNVQLHVNGGAQYAWSPAGSLNDPNINNPIAQPLNSTLYSVQVGFGNACPDITKNVQVTIMPLPPVSVGIDRKICLGDTLQLVAQGANSYHWQNSLSLSDTLSDTVKVYPLLPEYFKVYGTDNFGCSYYDSVLVTPILAPKPVINGPAQTCYGADIVLTATGGDEFNWSTGDKGNTISPTLFESDTFWVESLLEGCYGGVDSLLVKVDKTGFIADFDLLKDSIYEGEQVDIHNKTTQAIFYSWYAGDGRNPVYDSVPLFAYRNEGNYKVTLIAQSVNGCQDSVSKWLTVIPDFNYFPNAFTPNGDRLNDGYSYFFPYELMEVELRIFDRWGELLFTSTDQEHTWDGKYKGVEVPSGVYIYTFSGKKYTGERINKKGTITLLR